MGEAVGEGVAALGEPIMGPVAIPVGAGLGIFAGGLTYLGLSTALPEREFSGSGPASTQNILVSNGNGTYAWATNIAYRGNGSLLAYDQLGPSFNPIGSNSSTFFQQNPPIDTWDSFLPQIDRGPIPPGSVQFLQDGAAGSNGSSKSQLDVTSPGNSSFGNDYGDGNLPGSGSNFSVSSGNSVTPAFASGLFGDAASGLGGLFGDTTSALGNLLGSANYSAGFVPNGLMFGASFGDPGQANINLPGYGAGFHLPSYGGGSESGVGFNSIGDLGRQAQGWLNNFVSDVKSVFSSVGHFFGHIGSFFRHLFPVALDLNGDGVQLTPVTSSNTFFDMAGDGYQHLTSWAAPGDALLAYDANNDGKIDQQNEIDFTQWDPTATSDMQALRDVFDTNHDGKLSASDANFSQFKLIVTNADGTQTLQTLAQAGIASINLIEDQTSRTFADGSGLAPRTTTATTPRPRVTRSQFSPRATRPARAPAAPECDARRASSARTRSRSPAQSRRVRRRSSRRSAHLRLTARVSMRAG
jgi:hypothetical protein